MLPRARRTGASSGSRDRARRRRRRRERRAAGRRRRPSLHRHVPPKPKRADQVTEAVDPHKPRGREGEDRRRRGDARRSKDQPEKAEVDRDREAGVITAGLIMGTYRSTVARMKPRKPPGHAYSSQTCSAEAAATAQNRRAAHICFRSAPRTARPCRCQGGRGTTSGALLGGDEFVVEQANRVRGRAQRS
jgi:hypothetical protein